MIERGLSGATASYFKEIALMVRSLWISCVGALTYFFDFSELKREITEQYPDPVSSRTADDLPPRTRGMLFNDIEKCTGCSECTKVCPTDCIKIQTEPGYDANKRWVSFFDIDLGNCVFCGLCVEVCVPTSLVFTKKYEGAVCQLDEFINPFGRGAITEEQREHLKAIRRTMDEE